jgi:hypothetical protein
MNLLHYEIWQYGMVIALSLPATTRGLSPDMSEKHMKRIHGTRGIGLDLVTP